MTQNDFDFAIRVNYAIDDSNRTINKIIHQYANIRVTNRVFKWENINGTKISAYEDRELELIKCPPGRFKNETQSTENLGIETSYWCAKDLNFTL